MFSGVYSMLFGGNPYSYLLFEAVGLTPEDNLGKVCDTFVTDAGDKLYILTRNGDESVDLAEEDFKKKSTYVMKWIEQNDPTYVTYEFNVPETMTDGEGNVIDIRARIVEHVASEWNVAKLDHRRQILGDLKARRKTPEIQELIGKAKDIVRPIVKGWDGLTTIVDEASNRSLTVERLSKNGDFDKALSDKKKSDRNLFG